VTIWNLLIRELKTRYKGSVLGFFWSFLQPLLMMFVFIVVFGYIFGMRTDQPYGIFVLCGIIPWLFTVEGVNAALYSILQNANLINRPAGTAAEQQHDESKAGKGHENEFPGAGEFSHKSRLLFDAEDGYRAPLWRR